MDGECAWTTKGCRGNWKDINEINKPKNVTCMIRNFNIFLLFKHRYLTQSIDV